MIIKILIVLAIALIVFVIVVSLRPAAFRVSRSTSISAPVAVVFEQVNDLHKWQAWSPWAKLDPGMKVTYSGAPSGTGAAYAWVGNNQVGEGSMAITESQPNDLIRFNLNFLKPFQATNTAEFTFKSEGAHTLVTWSMSGQNNFMFKAVGLFMNCDKMVGEEFEKGLAKLKSVSEAEEKN